MGLQRLMKVCLDFAGAAALLVFLGPLLLVVGLVVFFDDGWPILYRRRVLGRKGEFDAYKFRTMRRGADLLLAADPKLKAEFENNFKLKNDPRLTRSGAILRRYSLDEMPQFLNVLAGQMSLVGPRMITPPELEKYGVHRETLLSVRPGMTGYWQVSGRQEVAYADRVRMDVYYIKNWSLWMDFNILLRTPSTVFQRKGAY